MSSDHGKLQITGQRFGWGNTIIEKPSADRLARKMDDLKFVERRCFRSKRKDWMYKYLGAVLAVYEWLKRRNQAKSSSRAMVRDEQLPIWRSSHPLRVLIEASSQMQDKKTKSRWGRALEQARSDGISPEKLSGYFRSQGGILACAGKAAHRRPRRKPVRIWV